MKFFLLVTLFSSISFAQMPPYYDPNMNGNVQIPVNQMNYNNGVPMNEGAVPYQPDPIYPRPTYQNPLDTANPYDLNKYN